MNVQLNNIPIIPDGFQGIQNGEGDMDSLVNEAEFDDLEEDLDDDVDVKKSLWKYPMIYGFFCRARNW